MEEFKKLDDELISSGENKDKLIMPKIKLAQKGYRRQLLKENNSQNKSSSNSHSLASSSNELSGSNNPSLNKK